jgi:hypothetical protein
MHRMLLAGAALSLFAAPARAQVALTWKPQPTPVLSRSSFKLDQTLTIGGMKFDTAVDGRLLIRTTAAPPGADGTTRVTQKTEEMLFDLTIPGPAKIQFDSKKPENKSDVPQIQAILDMWKSLTGASYTFVLKDGKTTAVEGVDKILETAPAASAEDLKRELRPERLTREFNQEMSRLPDKPVKVGDRWQRTEVMDIGSGQTLTYEVYYEYAGTVEKAGKTLDKITILAGEVKYAVADGPLPFKVTSSDLKVDSSMGYLLFDRAAGLIVELNDRQKISGPLTLNVNGMDLPSTVELTLESSSMSAPAN